MNASKTMFLRGAALVFSVVMLFMVVFVSNLGFQEVLDFRQLERIPLSLITDAVGGESQLHGRAEQSEALVKAPKTGTESIYYRYLLERKETDSDGNTGEPLIKVYFRHDCVRAAPKHVRPSLALTKISI